MVYSLPAVASWQLPVYNYRQTDYNAGTQNWQVKQQQSGWIYAANNYGLLEFDGFRWQHYGIWNSTVLRCLEIAPQGEIYVGGSNEFGVFAGNNMGMLSYRPLSQDIPEKYRNFGEIWNIHILNNDIYFQANYFIFKLESNGKISVIESKAKILASAKVDAGIYIAASDGLYFLAVSQPNVPKHLTALPLGVAKQMVRFGKESIIIGTESHGLYLFDGNTISRFATEADRFISSNKIYSMAVSTTHIAVGTVLNGLALIDLNTKKCRYVNAENGLQNNTVLSMCFDDSNNLWLGLDNGIDRVVINSPIQELYGKINSCGSGYGSIIYNNHLYLATNQGLYFTDYPMKEDGRLTNAELVSGSQGQVWSVDMVENNLIICHNRGLFVVDGNRVYPVSEADGFWQVRTMHGKPNIAVAGSYSGLYLVGINGKNIHIIRKIKGFEKTSRIFEIDINNRIVIISDLGIERLTFDEKMESVTSETIAAAQTPNDYFSLNKIDNKLIISNKKICLRTDSTGNFFEDAAFFNLLEGIFHYTQIKKDADNNIWYIAGDRLKVLPFDKNGGKYLQKPVQILNIAGFFIAGFASLHPTGNRQAVTGCVSGFALADLNNVKATPNSRQLFIRSIYTTNETDSLVYGESFPKQKRLIKIPYKNNSVRITFGGTFLLANANPEYRCCLEPIEKDFGSWNESSTKEYTSLHERKYRLVVESRNNDSAAIYRTEIEFEVLPPFYRSWWAYLIYSVMILAFLYAVYIYSKYRINRLKRKEARIKEQEMKEKEHKYLKEKYEHEKEMSELKNENIKFQLRNKTQELSNILLNHVNKKEILLELKQDLKKIQNDLHEKNYEQCTRKIIILQGKISQNVEQDIDWTRFEENFDIANDYFMSKLSELFPSLNKNERKLCIYIKMGLITKEIAPLMNLSTRGVEMMRYRMRKKMGISRENDLEVYFQTFNNDLRQWVEEN
jgi:DNA-binding CsgD family transcriptional regulator